MIKLKNYLLIFLLIYITTNPFFIFSENNSKSEKDTYGPKVVSVIKNMEELNSIVEKAGQRLLLFDLYADWCRPCKILSPILEKIAVEQLDKVSVYKINVDNNPQIASAFNVSGIPLVVFVKNKKAVYALTGLQSKDAYIEAINRFSKAE